jgi:hypothetical protein
VEGMNFTVYLEFTNTACYELRVLGTKIEDENGILHGQQRYFESTGLGP